MLPALCSCVGVPTYFLTTVDYFFIIRMSHYCPFCLVRPFVLSSYLTGHIYVMHKEETKYLDILLIDTMSDDSDESTVIDSEEEIEIDLNIPIL